MPLPSLRRLALADVNEATLRRLVEHGEDLLVERKRQLPDPPRFGAAAASFANTLGGWLLLGVKDDRTIDAGFEKPERLDLQSHLAAVLRNEVDPLPPFVAEMFEYEGKPIGVMRIFESADKPHIVRETGAVYVRDSEGKQPVKDHGTLLEIVKQGRDAEADARERIGSLPEMQRVLLMPDSLPEDVIAADDSDLRYVVRAAPVTMNPAAADWVLTRRGAETLQRVVDELLPRPSIQQAGPFNRDEPILEPYGRAMAATVALERMIGSRDSALVMADSGGAFAAELRRGPLMRPRNQGEPAEPEEHWFGLNAIVESEMRPLARALVDVLTEAEAIGRCLFDFWIWSPPNTRVHEARRRPRHRLYSAGELTIPADEDEVNALVDEWHRELQRQLGIVKFEGEGDAAAE